MTDKPTGKRFSLANDTGTKAPSDSQAKSEIAIDGGVINYGGWTTGTLKSNPDYSFHAKVFAQPSKFGIDEGKISKLDLRKDGQKVASFDRGWSEKPKTVQDQDALNRIRQWLGDHEAQRFKGFVKRICSGKGHSRGS